MLNKGILRLTTPLWRVLKNLCARHAREDNVDGLFGECIVCVLCIEYFFFFNIIGSNYLLVCD